MQSTRKNRKSPTPKRGHPPERLRELIRVAMGFERRAMQVYCNFESMFPEPEEVRKFWLDMAEHESRHFGGLALVAGLLESMPARSLAAPPSLTRAHVAHLDTVLTEAETESAQGLTLTRAFEVALTIETSEIEDLVLDLLMLLRGKTERQRAIQLLIHDLGDLSCMVEKYGASAPLLKRVDAVIEQRVGGLHRWKKRG